MRWLTQNRVGASAAGPNASTARASAAGPSVAAANIKNRQNIKNALLGAREQDVDIEKQNY